MSAETVKDDVPLGTTTTTNQSDGSGQKAVTIFDEPQHIDAPTYEDASSGLTLANSPKLHRASISGRKMTGRPSVQPLPSPALTRTFSHLTLSEGVPVDSGPGETGTRTPDARNVLAQVTEWLSEEKNKRRSRRLGADGTRSPRDIGGQSGSIGVDLDLDKLERILAGFGASNFGGEGKTYKKMSSTNLRRGSLLMKSRKQSSVGVSSDTEWVGDDINVPHVEASLDNSRTLAFTGGEADDDTSEAAGQKDQKYWDQFKQDIVRLTHTLRIRGWRRIPIEKGSSVSVERLSGALTNAVYVVRPPAEIPEPAKSTDGSKSYVSKSKPLELLLRIYGPQVEHLIDREDELLILRRLAKKKIGPRLLGYFTNGRFEEFLRAKTLTAEDIRVPETSKQIAKRMRELHDGIELLPSELEAGPRAFSNFEKWSERCDKVMAWLDERVKLSLQDQTRVSDRYTRRGFICGVEWTFFRQVFDRYRKKLFVEYGDEDGLRNSLVFAHNDTQYGNLMRLNPPGESPLMQPANQHRQLVVIDFEYASANSPGYEFANHFSEWCYNYHDAESSHACNTTRYPSTAEQYRFVRAYVMHRPQFVASASATPKMEGREKTNISDFMLDARAPGGSSSIDYDAEERAREEKVETDIQKLLRETRLWRIECAAQWVAWGIVQAKVPEFDKPITTKIGAVLNKLKDHLHARSDPLDADVKALQEASKQDRPEGREQEEAHAEGESSNQDEEAEDFDYLSYSQERAMLFWGDCLQMGIVEQSELPDSLLKQIKLVNR